MREGKQHRSESPGLRAARDGFDVVGEGARYGLRPEQAAALWAQVVAWDGLHDEAAAARRFGELAARRQVGKRTLVDGALGGGAVAGAGAGAGAGARVPGRTTRVLWEAAVVGEMVPRVAVAPPAWSALAAEEVMPPLVVAAAAWSAPVMRSAEAPAELDPRAIERIARALQGGAPLEDGLRARLEGSLGVRLDGVQIYIGPEADAAARSIGARAFAIGDDIVFRDGAYDPHSRAGQRLIAHEVAHTVQARGASLASARAVSEPDDAPEREADRFADAFVADLPPAAPDALVRDRSPQAVTLGTGISDPADRTPSAAPGTIFRDKADVAPRPGEAARRHTGVSPEVAAAYDAFLDGVYAAAAYIVSDNERAVEAWCDFVLAQLPPEQMAGQVFATGFEQLEAQAKANDAEHLVGPYANEANPVRQELFEQQMAGLWHACTGCHVAVRASAVDAQMRALHDRGRTPAELLQGYAHSPAPDRAAGSAAALDSAHASLARLQPMLQPLGDDGYKILPANLISRFGTAPLPQLRAELRTAFSRRVGGYDALLARIRDRSIDYLEFDSLLKVLRALTRPEVQALIEADERLRERRDLVRFAGMFLVDLLSVVLPPVGLVAGAFHVASGVDQYKVGTDRANATGAHAAMSPERQASGPLMQLAGALEAFGGAVQAGTTAAGLRAKPAAAVCPTKARVGAFTIERLEDGTFRLTHADFPGTSVVAHPDGTVHAFDAHGNHIGTTHLDDVQPGAPAANSNALVPGAGALQPSPQSVAPTAGPGATALTHAASSTLHVGGANPNKLDPTPWNPSGRADNCGYSSLSYAIERFSSNRSLVHADDLYQQSRQQLGVQPHEELSQRLVFPATSYAELKSRPGYEPLFNADGNRISEYTLPRIAQSLGLQGTVKQNMLGEWNFAFANGTSIEKAVEARLAFLESRGQHPNPDAVRGWIEAHRADLAGFYIIGSRNSSHFMTITIEPDGKMTGFDPQNHATYSTMPAVLTRMEGPFEFSYKVTGYAPPSGEQQ